MKTDNPFDRALNTRRIPAIFRNASVDVTDTLELAWDAARSVFEEKATPDHAIQICRMFLEVAGRIPYQPSPTEEEQQ
jgi:hypothetical protein